MITCDNYMDIAEAVIYGKRKAGKYRTGRKWGFPKTVYRAEIKAIPDAEAFALGPDEFRCIGNRSRRR